MTVDILPVTVMVFLMAVVVTVAFLIVVVDGRADEDDGPNASARRRSLTWRKFIHLLTSTAEELGASEVGAGAGASLVVGAGGGGV